MPIWLLLLPPSSPAALPFRFSPRSHVHVKRRNQTFVIPCRNTDQHTIGYVKSQVAKAVSDHDSDQDWTPDQLRLLLPNEPGTELGDDDTLDQHKLGLAPNQKRPTNSPRVLYMVFQVADNEWESVDIEPLEVDAPPAVMAAGS